MSQEIVHVTPAPLTKESLAQGGVGFKTGIAKLDRIKLSTLVINQRMTQAKDAVPGKLRVTDTGEQYEQITAVLLQAPVEHRAYHELPQPGAPKNQENKLCFSYDCVRPHDSAKQPQNMTCAGCTKADWSNWQKNKIPANIPPCEKFYYVVLIDTKTQYPLRSYIRGANKKAFEKIWDNIQRAGVKLQAEGKNPNLFDIKFNLFVQQGTKGTNYIFAADQFGEVTEDERQKFGDLYLKFVDQTHGSGIMDESEMEAQREVIEAELVAQPSNSADGEYITI